MARIRSVTKVCIRTLENYFWRSFLKSSRSLRNLCPEHSAITFAKSYFAACAFKCSRHAACGSPPGQAVFQVKNQEACRTVAARSHAPGVSSNEAGRQSFCARMPAIFLVPAARFAPARFGLQPQFAAAIQFKRQRRAAARFFPAKAAEKLAQQFINCRQRRFCFVACSMNAVA